MPRGRSISRAGSGRRPPRVRTAGAERSSAAPAGFSPTPPPHARRHSGAPAACVQRAAPSEEAAMFAQREVSHPQRLRRAAVAALILAAPLAAGLAAAQPAAAAFPGANGRIVFVGAGGLSTIKADGSGLKVLSTDEYSGPSFSPDGSRIALTDDNDQLLVMSANGGSATKIADGAQMPCWSPDGTKIAFGSLNGGIVTVNADGSGLAQLTTGSDTGCAWSPDGTQIAFSRWNGSNSTLFSVPAAGGSETQLTNTALSDELPDWSPDGTQIVFTRASVDVKAQVYVMNPDGSGATAITSSGANYHAVWSPSGRRIAFTSTRSKGLWLMGPDGSNQTHVKGTPAIYPDDWQATRVTATAS